ncbi:MAG TPA: ABC transporter permease [Planctomycetota bacterium]|jgi:ABC-2 type transport system permease protein|nr:ABC transporter permease [Planctomycetota bacterium]OQC21905.1 MAG: Inner membrane transport permease YbhS [Planctomycetes bacterium ADurb.Bin069]NMD36758.1 ABC transporter permease [Planctomycetota bacterium]HNS00003.1 ABC transporter permease [Planctomycetota bacterium]HNU27395.1 ABC transporter permease [Planctomycetota bacterium]
MNRVRHRRGAEIEGAAARRFDLRRLLALIRKESLQAWRDPSTLLIAFVLPAVLLFLFAYAVSLDVRRVRIGLVLESQGASAQALAAAFAATPYLDVTFARDRRELTGKIVSGALRGYVVIPQDFEHRLAEPGGRPLTQVITDGSLPNTASFVASYAQGVVQTWRAGAGPEAPRAALVLEPRYWFNAELESRRSLVPGAIAIVMTIIGTMLTALVVAREWERGTMEAVLSTPASVAEILIGKLSPYFVLGMLSTLAAAGLAIFVFQVPLRGSLPALLVLSAVFMVPALGQGLLISSLARNQFLAAQIALFSGFLPAFMLSGFLFEIDSMPVWIRAITFLVPARYFVASLKTVFLAGDIGSVFLPNLLTMAAIGLVFFLLAKRATRKSLE